MKATCIEWDTDTAEEKEKLPSEIVLPDSMTSPEEIDDYLSNVTGYCHKGYVLEQGEIKMKENINNAFNVYAVIAVTSMTDYTEPRHYSSAPDHEEVVALWLTEAEAQRDAAERNSQDLAAIEELECDPTDYVVRKLAVQHGLPLFMVADVCDRTLGNTKICTSEHEAVQTANELLRKHVKDIGCIQELEENENGCGHEFAWSGNYNAWCNYQAQRWDAYIIPLIPEACQSVAENNGDVEVEK